MFKIIKVTGKSLSPSFFPGDYVLIRTGRRFLRTYSPGDYVVFNHPDFGILIKKLKLNHPAGSYIEAEGLHPDTISTDKIGKIPYGDIIGKVVKRFQRFP